MTGTLRKVPGFENLRVPKEKKTRIGKFRKVFVLGRESGSTHETKQIKKLRFKRMTPKFAFAGCLEKGKDSSAESGVALRPRWRTKSSAERSGFGGAVRAENDVNVVITY